MYMDTKNQKLFTIEHKAICNATYVRCIEKHARNVLSCFGRKIKLLNKYKQLQRDYLVKL